MEELPENGPVLSSSCLPSVSMPYATRGLYLETQAGHHKLSSESYGFVARIDGSGNFQILLSDRHFNKTCGLCGDFNIFAEDDFRTQEGKIFWDSVPRGCGCVTLLTNLCWDSSPGVLPSLNPHLSLSHELYLLAFHLKA